MTEEHYFDQQGELHVIYLGPSDILDIPTDQDAVDATTDYAALAKDIADQEEG